MGGHFNLWKYHVGRRCLVLVFVCTYVPASIPGKSKILAKLSCTMGSPAGMSSPIPSTWLSTGRLQGFTLLSRLEAGGVGNKQCWHIARVR